MRGTTGPDVAPEPPRPEPVAGELVTEVFDYGGGRQVRVYVPPGRPEAVAFAGDGQLTFQWRGHLETAAAPPTLIVAVDRSAR